MKVDRERITRIGQAFPTSTKHPSLLIIVSNEGRERKIQSYEKEGSRRNRFNEGKEIVSKVPFTPFFFLDPPLSIRPRSV